MRRVLLNSNAVEKMREEMGKVWRTETGGVLVGYEKNESLFITDASGPGPRAELRMFSVLIDGVYAANFCAEACGESDGTVDYVGDWHCHLACSIKPSNQDDQAMRIMSDFEESPTRTPLSLIWSKYTGKCHAYLLTEGRRLKRIPCSLL